MTRCKPAQLQSASHGLPMRRITQMHASRRYLPSAFDAGFIAW